MKPDLIHPEFRFDCSYRPIADGLRYCVVGEVAVITSALRPYGYDSVYSTLKVSERRSRP